MSVSVLLLFLSLNACFACNNDLDCSYNGICNLTTKSCLCDNEWYGDNCGRLNILPTIHQNGYNETNTSSWGGSIIYSSSDKQWHMFVTRIKGNCGIKSFKNNSEIAHAISLNNNPLGPYIFKEIVLPYFAHNPSIYFFNNKYYLYHIGCGNKSTTLRTDCINGTTPGTPTDYKNINNFKNVIDVKSAEVSYCDVTNWTALLTTDSINGNHINFIKQANEILIINNTHNYSWTSNPAVLFNKNGSLYYVYRQNANVWPIDPDGTKQERLGVAFSNNNPDGPFRDLTPNEPIQNFHLEDPYIWRDKRGYFHMITHKRNPTGPYPNGCSSHLYSNNAINWIYGNYPPYNNTIYYIDGTWKKYENNARQRPQLVIENGKPKYLSTSVYYSNATGDYAITTVQPINSN